jgi:hypothetical protein
VRLTKPRWDKSNRAGPGPGASLGEDLEIEVPSRGPGSRAALIVDFRSRSRSQHGSSRGSTVSGSFTVRPGEVGLQPRAPEVIPV